MGNRKDVSAIVSAAGMMSSIWMKLDKKLIELGADPADIHLLSTDQGDSLITSIANMIIESGRFSRNSITFTISHWRSLAEMITDCHCSSVSEDFRENLFPFPKNCGLVVYEARFFQFKDQEDLLDWEIIKRIENHGFLPACPEHLTSLVGEYPEIASSETVNQGLIYALGKQLPRHKKLPAGWLDGTPCFDCDGRHLLVDWNRSSIGESDVFLGYRQRSTGAG